MEDLKASGHFLSADEIPGFDKSVTFKEITAKIKDQFGGFIIKDEGEPVYYVKASVMASRLDEIYQGKDTFKEFKFKKILQEVPQSVIRIQDLPGDTPFNVLQNREDAVFKVEDGLILNHEGLMTTLTTPVVFYCTNKKQPHENYTRDRNCRECGMRVNF